MCLWPDFVAEASIELAGSDVRLATVVNFPAGDDRPFAVSVLTERCLADGADEIDVVLPYRAFVNGHEARAAAVLDSVRATSDRALVKVILETGMLGTVEVVRGAARFAIDHGADFVKTSTGKAEVSATPDAVVAMLDVVAGAPRPVGIKPSGGISSIEAAATYLALADDAMGPTWVSPATFRFGASGLLGVLVDALTGVGADELEGDR